MMQKYGHYIIEYSNEGSESTADEKVIMLTNDEYENLYGSRKKSDFYGDNAVIGSDGHRLFESKLISEMATRLEPGDIICHPFGHAHQALMGAFPEHRHVETGIGYPTLMPDSFRIFESYAWMHYHQGKDNRSGKNYEWVVPNYYDLDDWEPSYEHGDYLAFLGRITPVKGMDTIRAIADYTKYPIVLHGQGDPTPWEHPMIEYRGPISGRARSDFLRNARALLAPTLFTEPFCGMSVEAMLCGTPVISVDYGAMTETVQSHMGFRCHTLQDWLDAIDNVGSLDRKQIASTARSRYSLEACGALYDRIFRQIGDLDRKGWYEVDQINFYEIEREEGPFAKRLAGWISDWFAPSEALDIGCGPGIYVNALREEGIDAVGIDIDERIEGRSNVYRESLLTSDRESEMVLCLEVAEHIEHDLSKDVASSVARALKPNGILIWSAAQVGQGGVGHINCQPKEFWSELLESEGLCRCGKTEDALRQFMKKGYHMGWFVNNLMVFTK